MSEQSLCPANTDTWDSRPPVYGFPLTSSTKPRDWPSPDVDRFDREEPILADSVQVGMLKFDDYQGLRPVTPLLVSVAYRDGFYEIEHQEFGIFGRGETQPEAVADFLEYLLADYRAYAEEKNENLNEGARALADRYRRMFGKS